MTDAERQSILGLCQQAMMADGSASAAEQQALRRVAERLQVVIPTGPAAPTSAEVIDVAGGLRGTGMETTAYEMAWAICAADGPPNAPEQWFLEALRGALGLSNDAARAVRTQAEAILAVPVAPPVITGPAAPPPAASSSPSNTTTPAGPDLDDLVQNTAIMAGALEIMPHSLATLAIVPVQMRMVYKIGKAYGYELDSGHIRDFLATVGVGLAAQMAESFAERAARGIFGGLLGGLGGGLLSQAAGSGVAFASTYALGELARQYYAGGRQFSAIELRTAYDNLLSRGRSLQAGCGSRIREQSGRIDPASLASFVRS